MNSHQKEEEREDGKKQEDTEPTETKTKTKKAKKKDEGFWKFTIIMLAVFLGIRFFVAEPFLVDGASMDPNFATNDYLIVDELSYKLEAPQRGDVIVLRPPFETSKYFIKRIVGLPGERIVVAAKQTYIYNKEHPEGYLLDEPYVKFNSDKVTDTTLGPTDYFVMGDNREVSFDSRSWGVLPRSDITGRAFLRLYPFKKISIFPGGLEEFSKKQ
ncbi:MAG: signal peptidase I [bacterium]